MSYLLQALKKAEQERQAQAASQPVAVCQAAPVASIPSGLVVIVVLVLLITVVKWFDAPASTEERVAAAPAMSAAPPEPAASVVNSPLNKPVHKQESKPVNNSPVEQPPEPAKVYELAEVPQEVLDLIPTLSLQSHIYSRAQAYRSVVINGQTFNEGMFIDAQVVLQEITNSGIVINVAGRQVALAKGLSWVSAKHVK